MQILLCNVQIKSQVTYRVINFMDAVKIDMHVEDISNNMKTTCRQDNPSFQKQQKINCKYFES